MELKLAQTKDSKSIQSALFSPPPNCSAVLFYRPLRSIMFRTNYNKEDAAKLPDQAEIVRSASECQCCSMRLTLQSN